MELSHGRSGKNVRVGVMRKKNGRPKTAISLRSLIKSQMEDLRGGDCLGKAAVSFERGIGKRLQQQNNKICASPVC